MFACEVAQNLALALLLLLVETSPFSRPLGEIFSKTWNGYIKLPGNSPKKSELTAKNDGNEQENPKTGSGWAVFSFKGCFKISNLRMLEVNSQNRSEMKGDFSFHAAKSVRRLK